MEYGIFYRIGGSCKYGFGILNEEISTDIKCSFHTHNKGVHTERMNSLCRIIKYVDICKVISDCTLAMRDNIKETTFCIYRKNYGNSHNKWK